MHEGAVERGQTAEQALDPRTAPLVQLQHEVGLVAEENPPRLNLGIKKGIEISAASGARG